MTLQHTPSTPTRLPDHQKISLQGRPQTIVEFRQRIAERSIVGDLEVLLIQKSAGFESIDRNSGCRKIYRMMAEKCLAQKRNIVNAKRWAIGRRCSGQWCLDSQKKRMRIGEGVIYSTTPGRIVVTTDMEAVLERLVMILGSDILVEGHRINVSKTRKTTHS